MLANYNAKISDIEEKYFTTLDYKKCTWHTWGKSKKKKKNWSMNVQFLTSWKILIITKLVTLATKAELKAAQDKTVKMKTHDLSYLIDKRFFGDDDFQNIFVYQPTLDTLELKIDRSTD